MAQRGKGWDAPMDGLTYHRAWAPLNTPLIEAALPHLPLLNDAGGWVHVAGVGTGMELPLLRAAYPRARFLLSDLTSQFLPVARSMGQPLATHGPFVLADMATPPCDGLQLSFSSFALHVSGDPLAAVQGAWASLAPGGGLVALFYPPVPQEGGPLFALFDAMRSVRPDTARRKPDWLVDVLAWLQSQPATLGGAELTTTWDVDSPADLRSAFEHLPHIRAARHGLGDDRYEAAWTRFLAQPGLTRADDDRWRGPVTALLLLARRDR